MIRPTAICTLLFCSALSGLSSAGQPDIVATVAGQSVTLEEVDTAGGPSLHELATELYTIRVQTLYGLLGEQLMALEAAKRGMEVEALREMEITDRLSPVTPDDVTAFIGQSPTLSINNGRDRSRAELYLRITGRQERTTQYITELMARHNVEIALRAPAPPPPERIEGAVAPLVGRPDAPISIVVFSDYQCAYCQRYERNLHDVQSRFPNTVNLVTRYFPSRDDGKRLAEAALCAHEQGRYRDYHDALFARTRVNAGHVMDVAYSLDLDRGALASCLESSRYSARIDDDIAEGRRLAVEGTPTSFVNGVRVRGLIGTSELAAMVEAALAQAGPARGS